MLVEVTDPRIDAQRFWRLPLPQRDDLIALLERHGWSTYGCTSVSVDVIDVPLLRIEVCDDDVGGRHFLRDPATGRPCEHSVRLLDAGHELCEVAKHVEEKALRGPLPSWWKALPAAA